MWNRESLSGNRDRIDTRKDNSKEGGREGAEDGGEQRGTDRMKIMNEHLMSENHVIGLGH